MEVAHESKTSKALNYNEIEKRQSDVSVRKRSRIAELPNKIPGGFSWGRTKHHSWR